MTAILTLRGVEKVFEGKERFLVLQDISLEVNEGEFVSIVGPSGCGKSVLLYLMAGFLKKTSGDLLLRNRPIEKPGIDRMMVFQDYVLLPWKTVKENILFGLDKSALSSEEKEKRLNRYLQLVGLTQFRDWYPHKLSGGMKQKVAIARALIVDTQILLMDEPFSALDHHQRKYLQKNLLEIWQTTKNTVLFVTHSVSEALYLSDRIYVMSKRPAVIKSHYIVNMPRPRNFFDVEFIRLKAEIEKDLAPEFDEHLPDGGGDALINELLKKKSNLNI